MKYTGELVNVFCCIPHGSMRKIQLRDENGNDQYLRMHFKPFDKQIGKIKLGTKIEVSYQDEEHFIVKKV
jgi:hypothetical protein